MIGAAQVGLGRPFAEVWSEIWEQFQPIVEATLAGEAQVFEDLSIPMMRHGYRIQNLSSVSCPSRRPGRWI